MTGLGGKERSDTEAKPSGGIGAVGKLKILIADDHSLVRDAIAETIRNSSNHEVLVAGSLNAALSVVRDDGPIDILMLDLNMPDMEGINSIEKVVTTQGVMAVILFSGNAPRDIVLQALAKGAKGYIPKSMRLSALLSALNFVAMGETYLPASLLSGDGLIVQEGNRATSPAFSLSSAEAEVLRLVVDGLPNKEIARRCGSTEIRVKMHMRSICKKLGVPNRTSAALRARDLHLI